MGRHANHLHLLLRHFAWERAECSPAQLASPAWDSRFDRATAAIGGGHYPRLLPRVGGARFYRVRKLCASGEFATVTQALAQWNADKQVINGPRAAIIEIGDSGTYHEAPAFHLGAGEELQLRAADMTRPVLRMFDYHCGTPERIAISGGPGSRFTVDGLMVAGGPLVIEELAMHEANQAPCQVSLRHCTLVPGWETEGGRDSPWRGKTSILLGPGSMEIRIDHCIVGIVRMPGDPQRRVRALHVSDSIVDSGHESGLAIADDGYGSAMARATFVRSTVVGAVQIEELALAENAVFLGVLLTARRDTGSMRYCYVSPGSRTPPRLQCQPDLVQHSLGANAAREQQRVRPRYRSLHYGAAGYCTLAPDCAGEIADGADDDSEMGAWHDLHQSPLVLNTGWCGG